MALFGSDFSAAKRQWLYKAENRLPLLTTLGLFAGLIVTIIVMQTAAAYVGAKFLYSHAELTSATPEDLKSYQMRGTILSMIPAGVLTAAIAYFCAGLGRQRASDVLALKFPKLGPGGWISILFAFLFSVVLVNWLVLFMAGIDPAQYGPDGGSGGQVERAIYQLADEPMLFALAIPAITMVAPLVEELVFRGAVFAAIRQTQLGSIGASVVTSASWALMHAAAAPSLFVGLLFLMGLILSYLLLRFGSLWVPIACHCAWNSIQAFALFAQAGTT
jgi:uncharacterized protein